MGATIDQIEGHIDSRRAELGAHLEELERKVGALADWREHFRERPWLFVTAAFAGGAVLAASLGSAGEVTAAAPDPREALPLAPHRDQVLETWGVAKDALVGLAMERVIQYVAELIPGFADQFETAKATRARNLT